MSLYGAVVQAFRAGGVLSLNSFVFLKEIRTGWGKKKYLWHVMETI